MKHRLTLLRTALPLLALVVAACGGAAQEAAAPTPGDTGQPRTFAMGLSSLPPELTEESYASTFELAASAGEVILIRRTPPWKELLTDAPFPSGCTKENTQRETALAEQHELDIFVAIDVAQFSEGCDQGAALSAELRGAGFADEKVRRAFIEYAQYVAVNYRPAYLALGVEVNTFEEESPENFEQFVSLYNEAYDAVKQLSPETLVFPTFQLEKLDASLPSEKPRRPQWHLISRFASRMDLFAVSTYPNLAYSDPEQIPADYYLQLAAYTDLPIAIADMGYSSGPVRNGLTESSEGQQAAFLRRTLDDAQRLGMPLVVWFVGQDTTFTGEPPFDLLQHIGLLRQDGTKKGAWREWERTARRPLDEGAIIEPLHQ
jgi:hypothetical protein